MSFCKENGYETSSYWDECEEPGEVEGILSEAFGFEEEMVLEWGSENILFLKKGDCRLELIEESGEDAGSKCAFLHIAWKQWTLKRKLDS